MKDRQDIRAHPNDELLLRRLDGELTSGRLETVEDHLERCAECRTRWETICKATGELGKYSGSIAGSRSADSLRQSLVTAMETRTTANVAKAAGRPRKTALVLALAAAIVMAVGISIVRRKQPGPAVVSPEVDTLAKGFITLPYSDKNLSDEGAVVLQVEVPRSALLLTGMPASAGQSGEHVRAEVIVGADGLARAIRFLN